MADASGMGLQGQVVYRLAELASLAMELFGIAIIVIGAAALSVVFLPRLIRHGDVSSYTVYRGHVGRAILLGLEFLVAADIINTVAVDLTFQSLGSLAILVVIRTFLSLSLEVEIEGKWPWQQRG